MLLKEEADKLSLNDLQLGVITQIVTVSGLFNLLPVRPINGKAFQYTREKSLGAASWVGPTGHIKESTATYETVTTVLKACIGDADVPDQVEDFDSAMQSPTALQIEAKTKVILREIERILIKGNSTANPDEPDGLEKLVVTSQTVGADNENANGGKLAFKDLDRLKARIKVGTPSFFVCNTAGEIIVRELFRSKNLMPEHMALPNFNPGVRFLTYAGIPFMVDDWLTSDETKGTSNDCTSIYLVAADEAQGFTGLISRKGAGVRIKTIGTLPDKDADRIRVKMYFGTASRSDLALARLNGIRDI